MCIMHKCGFTSGLATTDLTEDPVAREYVDETGELVSIVALDRTELWKHTVYRQVTKKNSVQQALLVCMIKQLTTLK